MVLILPHIYFSASKKTGQPGCLALRPVLYQFANQCACNLFTSNLSAYLKLSTKFPSNIQNYLIKTTHIFMKVKIVCCGQDDYNIKQAFSECLENVQSGCKERIQLKIFNVLLIDFFERKGGETCKEHYPAPICCYKHALPCTNMLL